MVIYSVILHVEPSGLGSFSSSCLYCRRPAPPGQLLLSVPDSSSQTRSIARWAQGDASERMDVPADASKNRPIIWLDGVLYVLQYDSKTPHV